MQICSIDTSAMIKDIDSLHPTTRYAVEVVAGLRGPVCEWEWKACERHLKDLKRQGTEDFPYIFDESRADRIFNWFEKCCRHPRGVLSGQLIKLNSSQKFDYGSVFGWTHKDTGRRRFKKALSLKGRGNAKTTELSAVGLYGMCSDCAYPPNYGAYKKNGESRCVKNCCTCCEKKGLCNDFQLDSIWHGTSSEDYFNYLEDAPDTTGWIETPIMFVLENPSKLKKWDETKKIDNKQVMITWPNIGWKKNKVWKNHIADFNIEDNFRQGAYGEMICSAMLNYKLKNVYVTNLVKCGYNEGKHLQAYKPEIIENCINTVIKKEIEAFQPKIIFALGVKVEGLMKKYKNKLDLTNAEIIYIPHPARRGLKREIRKKMLCETFESIK